MVISAGPKSLAPLATLDFLLGLLCFLSGIFVPLAPPDTASTGCRHLSFVSSASDGSCTCISLQTLPILHIASLPPLFSPCIYFSLLADSHTANGHMVLRCTPETGPAALFRRTSDLLGPQSP